MKKIESLTPEQTARFDEFIKKWTDIGLCTQPANRKLAEEGIIEAYANAGLEAPKIVWCDSPLSMAVTRAVVQKIAKGEIDIRASVGDSVWASVGDSVWASVRASVRASVGDSVWDSVYGQHDANWLAFYDFFFEVCGLEQQTKKLSGLWKVAQNAGWFLPHEKICWISERHSVVSKDDAGQLHNESGPSVLYPDGWAIYKIHGVTVPAFVVENPEQITVDVIESEENSEVRRVMVDRYGRGKYLKDTGAKIIHQDDWGTLYKKEILGQEPMVFVGVVNSTPEPDGSFNDYFLRVHPELRPITNNRIVGNPQKLTALNAVASTFGLTGEEYVLGLTESPNGTPEMAIKMGRMS